MGQSLEAYARECENFSLIQAVCISNRSALSIERRQLSCARCEPSHA
jgi:hypothetical protein